MRTSGSFTRDAASSQSFARRRQASARSPISAQTACVLGPFRLWLWCETLFRHLPKRMFTSYRWGPGEGGVRGERRGMAGTPRTRAVSIFDRNEIARADVALRQRAALAPQPLSGPCQSPAQAGLLFSWRRHPASLCWPSHSEYPVQATKTELGRPWRASPSPRPPRSPGPEA